MQPTVGEKRLPIRLQPERCAVNQMLKHYHNPLKRSRLWYGARGHALATTVTRLCNYRIATLVTLMVIGVSLSLPTLFVYLSPQLGGLADAPQRSAGMTLYLTSELTDLQGAALATSLQQREDIRETTYISRDEALATLHQHTSLTDAIDTLGENPLPGAVVVQPALQDGDAAAHRLLATQLSALEGVDNIQLDLQWVTRLQALTALFKQAALVIGVILVLASLMVIANTIRLELLRHARESRVASLLGATPAFTRRPFIYLGATYGILGALIASAIAIGIIMLLNRPVTQLAASYASPFRLQLPSMQYIASLIAISMFLGIAAAVLTLFRRTVNIS